MHELFFVYNECEIVSFDIGIARESAYLIVPLIVAETAFS